MSLSQDKKWSLVWSPLNTCFGPIYPFFHNLEPGLHYVLWKSIWIKHRYLNWRVCSLENWKSTRLLATFLLPRLSFWIFHLFWTNFEFLNAWWNDQKKNEMTKKNEKWKKEKKKEWGSRVKTQKGQSRAKEEVLETLSRVSKIEMQHPGYFRSLWKPSNPLKLGQIFENTLVRKNENPRTKICS